MLRTPAEFKVTFHAGGGCWGKILWRGPGLSFQNGQDLHREGHSDKAEAGELAVSMVRERGLRDWRGDFGSFKDQFRWEDAGSQRTSLDD